MRRTIIMLLLLATAAWFAPPLAEDVGSQCAALEARALREQTLQTPEGKEDPGHAATVARRAAADARARQADLPAGVACAIGYWELWSSPDLTAYQSDPPAR